MGIFDRFPYSSTHEMNLDFMLGKATEIAESLQKIDTHKDQAEQAATNAAQSAQSAAQAAQAAAGSQTAAGTSASQAAQHKADAEDAADRAEAASNLADEAVEQAQAAVTQAQTAATNASTAADGAIASAAAAETRINNLAASLPEDFTELNNEVTDLKSASNLVENGVVGWESKSFRTFAGLIDSTNGGFQPSDTSSYTVFNCAGLDVIEFEAWAYSTNYGYAFMDAEDVYISGAKTTETKRMRVAVPSNAYAFKVCWNNNITQSISVGKYVTKTIPRLESDVSVLSGGYQFIDITNINTYGVYNTQTIGDTIALKPTAVSVNYASQIVPVSKGQKFKVTGKGASSYVLWAFTDINRKVLALSNPTVELTDETLTAPDDGYLYFQPNVNQLYKIETYIADYRQNIVITNLDNIQIFYEKMRSAYYIGNCDIFIRKGTYTFTNTVIENILNDGFRGIPIGNGCRYYFDPATHIVCEYTGSNAEVKTMFSPFDSNSRGGDYEIYGLDLIAKNTIYAIHDESASSTQKTIRKYKNCNIKIDNTALGTGGSNLSKCIGGGAGLHEEIEIDGCTFSTINLNASYQGADVSYHDPSTGSYADVSVYIRNSYFENTFRSASFNNVTTAPYMNIDICGCSFGESPSFSESHTHKMWCNEIRA